MRLVYKNYALSDVDTAELLKVCNICKFRKHCKKIALLKEKKLMDLCLLHKSILKLCFKKLKSKEGEK